MMRSVSLFLASLVLLDLVDLGHSGAPAGTVANCVLGCPQYDQPVCAQDGTQYPNLCHATCNSAVIRCFERCSSCQAYKSHNTGFHDDDDY